MVEFGLGYSHVAHLDMLRGMKSLRSLNFVGTLVPDLAPLQGQELTSLAMTGTDITDLSSLLGILLLFVNNY